MGSDVLIAHSYALPRGPRVRLRLARPRDAEEIRGMLSGQGETVGELDVARLVRFDPRRRFVVCATALIGGREVVVGIGAIALGPEATAEPEMLVVDDGLGKELGELLRGVLVSRALARAA